MIVDGKSDMKLHVLKFPYKWISYLTKLVEKAIARVYLASKNYGTSACENIKCKHTASMCV